MSKACLQERSCVPILWAELHLTPWQWLGSAVPDATAERTSLLCPAEQQAAESAHHFRQEDGAYAGFDRAELTSRSGGKADAARQIRVRALTRSIFLSLEAGCVRCHMT